MSKTYESHCTPTEISATSRESLKVLVNGREQFFTVEAYEKRAITNPEGIDMEQEFKMLFDELNNIIDFEAQDVIDTFKNKR